MPIQQYTVRASSRQARSRTRTVRRRQTVFNRFIHSIHSRVLTPAVPTLSSARPCRRVLGPTAGGGGRYFTTNSQPSDSHTYTRTERERERERESSGTARCDGSLSTVGTGGQFSCADQPKSAHTTLSKITRRLADRESVFVSQTFFWPGRSVVNPIKLSPHLVWSPCKIWLLLLIYRVHVGGPKNLVTLEQTP